MSDPTPPVKGLVNPIAGHMDALPAGTMLGEFELQELLGVGGFGMVYRGYDHSLHRQVAIKEYMPTSLAARGDNLELSVRSTADHVPFYSGLNSFMAEARLLARFDHPSLVKVYRFWEANNTAYMAMPLYRGITLKQARAQMSSPPPEEWLRVVLWSVLEALKVLHDSNTLHRDVSPDNIFLQDIGPPVLLDLGAARRAIVDSDRKHTAVLKVNYAPIEQFADTDAPDLREGPWTDLYAVAAVIHGCLRNEPPLPATIRVVRDRLPSMARVANTVENHLGMAYSPAFINAMDHALSIKPGDRPKSVEAMVDELQLRPIDDLPHFDWRKNLGGWVTLNPDAAVQAHLTTQPHNTVERKRRAKRKPTDPLWRPPDFEETQLVQDMVDDPLWDDAVVKPKSKSRSHGKSQTPSRKLLWIALIVAIGLAVALGAVVRQGRNDGATQTPSVAATPAVPVVPSEPVLAVVPAPLPKVESPVDTVSAVVASAPASAPVSFPASRPAKARTSATKPSAADASNSASKPAVEPTPVRPANAEAEAPPAPKPRPAAVVRELCADSSLFAKPMCIYQECQKPDLRNTPVCVESMRRWEERRNSSQ
jgi:serine/threonine protein kinase